MRTIKRYSNRKLYDTWSGSYVTLDQIADLIRQGEEIEVLDHSTGENLTTITLMQIIFEEEKRSASHLSHTVLTRALRAGKDLQAYLNTFLDPDSTFEIELKRRVARLVRHNTFLAEESERILSLILDPAMKTPEPEEIPANPEEVAALRAQVEKLESLIRELNH